MGVGRCCGREVSEGDSDGAEAKMTELCELDLFREREFAVILGG